MNLGEHTRPRVCCGAPSRLNHFVALELLESGLRRWLVVFGEGAKNDTRGRVCSPTPVSCQG